MSHMNRQSDRELQELMATMRVELDRLSQRYDALCASLAPGGKNIERQLSEKLDYINSLLKRVRQTLAAAEVASNTNIHQIATALQQNMRDLRAALADAETGHRRNGPD